MTRRTAFNLALPGTSSQALEYYQAIFGGELSIQKYSDFPDMDMGFETPPPADAVAHGELRADGLQIAVGDDIQGQIASMDSDAYSLLNLFDNVEEARALWTKFIASGSTEVMPLEAAPWGDYYGILKDPFGIQWHFDATEGEQA